MFLKKIKETKQSNVAKTKESDCTRTLLDKRQHCINLALFYVPTNVLINIL